MNLNLNKVDGKPFIFPTGSKYYGEFDELTRMTGYGVFVFPNKAEYRGFFEAGQFHGPGVIMLESGAKMYGNFHHGECNHYEIEFLDGLRFDKPEDWTYCRYPDRRFWEDIEDGISPVGESLLTASGLIRDMPDGWFDCEEGLYNPDNGCIVNATDLHSKLRILHRDEREWVTKRCRSTNMNPIGFQQEIVDENVLSFQEYLESDLPSECHCFSESGDDSSTLQCSFMDLRVSKEMDVNEELDENYSNTTTTSTGTAGTMM